MPRKRRVPLWLLTVVAAVNISKYSSGFVMSFTLVMFAVLYANFPAKQKLTPSSSHSLRLRYSPEHAGWGFSQPDSDRSGYPRIDSTHRRTVASSPQLSQPSGKPLDSCLIFKKCVHIIAEDFVALSEEVPRLANVDQTITFL